MKLARPAITLYIGFLLWLFLFPPWIAGYRHRGAVLHREGNHWLFTSEDRYGNRCFLNGAFAGRGGPSYILRIDTQAFVYEAAAGALFITFLFLVFDFIFPLLKASRMEAALRFRQHRAQKRAFLNRNPQVWIPIFASLACLSLGIVIGSTSEKNRLHRLDTREPDTPPHATAVTGGPIVPPSDVDLSAGLVPTAHETSASAIDLSAGLVSKDNAKGVDLSAGLVPKPPAGGIETSVRGVPPGLTYTPFSSAQDSGGIDINKARARFPECRSRRERSPM